METPKAENLLTFYSQDDTYLIYSYILYHVLTIKCDPFHKKRALSQKTFSKNFLWTNL